MSNQITGYANQSRNAIAQMDFRILAAFAATYILWGSTYLAISVAVTTIPPFLMMGSRSVVGGLLLFAYARRNGGPLPKHVWLISGACGILLFVGCHGAMAYAQQRVPSGIAAIILATIPFWIAIIGFVVPGKRPAKPWTLALLIPGLAGVALIAWHQVASAHDGLRLSDIMLLLGASFAWALGSILLERNTTPGISPFALSGMALIAGGIALLGVSAAAGEFQQFSFAQLSAASIAGWAYLLLAGTVVAFGSYVWLLGRVSPTLVATYTFVNPIIAVLLGWAFLGEAFSALTLLGGALVVGSIVALLVFSPPRDKSKQQ